MIKRQFYTLEHRSRDNEASSSSSEDESASSSPEDEGAPVDEASSSSAAPADESEEQHEHEASSPGQWKSHDVDGGIDVQEDLSKDNGRGKEERLRSSLSNQWAVLVAETLNDGATEFSDDCVVRCKNVFKCRLCPKIICLTSETMQAHLVSKKHERSLKQFKEGKLKVMLNSDGEEEEQGETHAERHARIVASFKEGAVEEGPKRKRSSGRQRQRKRAKKKAQLEGSMPTKMQTERRIVRVVKKEPSVTAETWPGSQDIKGGNEEDTG